MKSAPIAHFIRLCFRRTARFALLPFALLPFAIACQNAAAPSRTVLKQQLKNLDAFAYKGTYDQAISAGEKALKMMDIDEVRDSDQMVKDGEDNFTFEAFDESLRIFEMALMKNEHNEKAQAYIAILTPVKYLKGIYWRTSQQDNDEWIGYAILQSYQNSKDLLASQFDRFMYTPYKEKFTRWDEAQQEVLKPFGDALLKSTEIWDRLHQKLNIDFYLYLPKIMTSITPVHVRTADALVASSVSLGFATYIKFYTLYNLSSAPLVRPASTQDNPTPETDWQNLKNDPQFGILADPSFLRVLKGRYLQFSSGIDMAYEALKQREKTKQNDAHDLAQINRGVISACTVDKFHTRLSYEAFSCNAPRDFEIPYIFSFVADPTRRSFATKITENSAHFDPSAEDLKKEVEIFKNMLFGPTQREIGCAHPDGSDSVVKYWVDLPTYLQNPIKDLKSVGPLFDAQGTMRDLKDRTVHGLFPQGLPCAY